MSHRWRAPFAAALACVVSGCTGEQSRAERAASESSDKPDAERIHWPAEYKPTEATFFVHNEIEIQAPPEVAWGFLMRAESWPDWYPGATGVKVISPPGGRLESGSVFTWNTMDLDLESRVGEFKPPARLAWETRKESIRGYHTWLLVPTGTGCRVVTDEAQHGRLAFAQKVFLPKKLHELHAVWLRELKRRAEAAAAVAGGEG